MHQDSVTRQEVNKGRRGWLVSMGGCLEFDINKSEQHVIQANNRNDGFVVTPFISFIYRYSRINIGLLIAIVFIMNSTIGCAQTPIASTSSSPPNSEKQDVNISEKLMIQGKNLRKAIDEKYQELDAQNAIKSLGNGRNIITDVVVRFIPLSSPFDDAEKILKAAGFQVGERSKSFVYPYGYEVHGSIDPYIPLLLGKVTIHVFLRPDDPKTWLMVKTISAGIVRHTL